MVQIKVFSNESVGIAEEEGRVRSRQKDRKKREWGVGKKCGRRESGKLVETRKRGRRESGEQVEMEDEGIGGTIIVTINYQFNWGAKYTPQMFTHKIASDDN